MRRSPLLRASGFSLVELIAVTAVLLLLVTLLFPMAGKLVERSRSAKCTGNLKQIGIALNAYIGDNGFYPGAIPETGLVWYDVLCPFLDIPNDYSWPRKLGDTFRCPSRNYSDGAFIGYGYNYTGFGYSSDSIGGAPLEAAQLPPRYWRVRPPKVEHASRMIVIGDNADGGGMYSAQLLYQSGWGFARRHSGGGNFLCADGHIEWLTEKMILDREMANMPFY